MATEKQTQANRNNAQKSTGPRTEGGKSRASQNARKHGLLAGETVLPGEDPAEFEAQLAALEADIRPEGALECELVRQMADAQWRMRRLSRLETAYLIAGLENRRGISAVLRRGPKQYSDEENTLMLGYSLAHQISSLGHLARYDAHLSRRFERALQQNAKLREAREKRAQAPLESPRGPLASTEQPTAPGVSNAVETPKTEICETNPISPNQNGINKIAAANLSESHPARPDTHPTTAQPTGGRPGESQITSVNGMASPQNPLHR